MALSANIIGATGFWYSLCSFTAVLLTFFYQKLFFLASIPALTVGEKIGSDLKLFSFVMYITTSGSMKNKKSYYFKLPESKFIYLTLLLSLPTSSLN